MWSEYPELKNELLLVEELIKKNIHSRNKLLSNIAEELVEAGGKRLRPAFTIVSAGFGNYNREKVLPMAGAIEILHTATLVHDDVIDRSKLRRGRTTVSEKYGMDMAVYTGDFLLTKAILMLSKDISIDNLEYVANAVKTICEGEVDQFQERYNVNISVLAYLKRIKRKTAVLFGASCGLGAYIADCPKPVATVLAKFGLNYGIAFQIKDDINDFVQSEGKSGKPVEKDLMEGVITLPVIYAIRKSLPLKSKLSLMMQNKDNIRTEDIIEISKLVVNNNGVAEAYTLLRKYIKKCRKQLDKLPDNRYKELLSSQLDNLVK